MTRPPIPVLIIAVLVMLAIVGAGFWYVGRKLHRFLRLVLPGAGTQVFAGICILFFLTVVLSFMPFDMGVKRMFVWLASFFFGLFACLLLVSFVSDAVILAGRAVRLIASPVPDKIIITAGWVIVSAAALLSAYGVYNADNLRHASYHVAVNKETSLDALKIVLVADTHLGYLNSAKWLERLVSEINAQNPDIVCFAGDIFNDDINAVADKDESIRILRNISSVYGVYACFGNHDGGATHRDMIRFLADSNIILLQDEFVTSEDKFTVIGRTESSPIGAQDKVRRPYAEVVRDVDTTLPVIVIDHNPANIGEYGGETDLVLCGHTHRGQIFPGSIITGLMYTADYGYYQKDAESPHIIVTSGASTWGPPMRIGTQSEIVSISVDFNKD